LLDEPAIAGMVDTWAAREVAATGNLALESSRSRAEIVTPLAPTAGTPALVEELPGLVETLPLFPGTMPF